MGWWKQRDLLEKKYGKANRRAELWAKKEKFYIPEPAQFPCPDAPLGAQPQFCSVSSFNFRLPIQTVPISATNLMPSVYSFAFSVSSSQLSACGVQFPAAGIHDPDVPVDQRDDTAVGLDQRPAEEARLAVIVAHLEDHQIAAVVEAQRELVRRLVRFELHPPVRRPQLPGHRDDRVRARRDEPEAERAARRARAVGMGVAD